MGLPQKDQVYQFVEKLPMRITREYNGRLAYADTVGLPIRNVNIVAYAIVDMTHRSRV